MAETAPPPIVSIFVITYRHEKYIAQCLDSLLAQVTDFPYQIVLGEDFSPDRTREICMAYAEKYPDKINLLPTTENMGAVRNGLRTYKACTGRYIAMCEGDDYWTDIHKLQKQVDFLEANPEYSMCFSLVEIVDELGWDKPYEFYYKVLDKQDYTIEDFIMAERNLIPTPAFMFRNIFPEKFPDFLVNARVGDLPVQLMAAEKGMARLLPGRMAVYRNHEGGATKSEELLLIGQHEELKLFHGFNKYTDYKYNKLLRQRFLGNAKVALIFGSRNLKGMAKLRNYFLWFPEYMKYSDKLNIREIMYYHTILFAPWVLRLFASGGKQSSEVNK